jgi:hypothetical protein
MMKMIRSKQPGFGLIEVLLSLAVAAAIIVLGVNYYSNLRSSQKTGRFINQMHGIGKTVENYIAKHPGTDLSKVFGGGKSDVASNAALAFSALDVQNAWAPTTKYKIMVTPGGCNTIQVQIPSGLNNADCNKFKDKIGAAFGNVSASCSGATPAFSYCANKITDQ